MNEIMHSCLWETVVCGCCLFIS